MQEMNSPKMQQVHMSSATKIVPKTTRVENYTVRGKHSLFTDLVLRIQKEIGFGESF
jgi:hypothetical protein